jgi:hypothetical protein
MSWGMVAGAAITVVGGYMTSKQQAKSNKSVSQAAAAQDPYGPYRAGSAQKLNDLMSNPSQISDTPEYKSRQMAASRLMAAQGYTGSGNALAAAAEAGGNSYQQAFNNLAMLSGASGPAGAGAMQGAAITSGNNQYANNQYGQIANGLVGAGIGAYNNYQNNKAWNTPINSGIGAPTVSAPTTDYNVNTNPGYISLPVTSV